MATHENAPAGGIRHRGRNIIELAPQRIACQEDLGLIWRRVRGLLTIADHRRHYLAIRNPRGPYRTPMPADLIGRRS